MHKQSQVSSETLRRVIVNGKDLILSDKRANVSDVISA